MNTLQTADTYLRQGKKGSAKKIILNVLKKDPDCARAWYLLSFSLEEQKGKIRSLQQALKLNPQFSAARKRLEEIRSKPVGDENDVSEREAEMVLKRAASALNAGNLGTARSLVKNVLRKNKNNLYAWYMMSFCSRERAKKISALHQALQINSSFELAKKRLEKIQGSQKGGTPATVGDEESKPPSTWLRVAKFASLRVFSLAAAMIIGVFLTILIATKGTVIESEITGNLLDGWLGGVWSPIKLGVVWRNRPEYSHLFGEVEGTFMKAVVLLFKGLTFNLGDTNAIKFYTGEQQIGSVFGLIKEFLPRTLFLFGLTNLILFLVTVFIALRLSRNYGKWLDRLVTILNPLSSIPSWVYGLVLTVVFVRVFHFYSGGRLESWPTEYNFKTLLTLGKKLLIPVLAILISKFFQSVYTWRTFFLIYSTEDYVDLAQAKGLSKGKVMRKYILKPTLPIILTRFSMILISIWQEAIIIELFFNVAGIGHLFYQSLLISDIPLIVGLVVIFAYTIGISVFVLDFIYAIIDPRVRVGGKKRVSPGRFSGGIGDSLSAAWRRLSRGWKYVFVGGEDSFSIRGFWKLVKDRLRNTWELIHQGLRGMKGSFQKVLGFPSAIVGLSIIMILVLVSLITVIAIPYPKAVNLWRDDDVWVDQPRKAKPIWINVFRSKKLPRTLVLDSKEGQVEKEIVTLSDQKTEINLTFTFNYAYDGFPKDVVLYLEPTYEQKHPFVTLLWKTPDGPERELRSFSLSSEEKVVFSEESRLARALESQKPHQALFANYTSEPEKATQGTYQLHVDGLAFEKGTDLEAKLVVMGQVHGVAGTDHKGRDLSLALLWGTPIALGFGLLASFANSIITMTIAAVGTWFGGWVDTVIQRVSDINMIIPVFPILLMVYNWFSNRLWVILAVYILLGIFGAGIKTYRSAFLQVREMPYMEAAQAYGAGNMRMIFFYLVPRTISILIPQLINMVPTIVFLETTLAYLNMSDPLLPTWGKVIREAFAYGGLDGFTYWILEPFALMLFTAFGFLILGASLERIFDPRLQEQ